MVLSLCSTESELSLLATQNWVSSIGYDNVKYLHKLVIVGFDCPGLDALTPKRWTPIRIRIDLRKLSITGFETDHQEEHLAWKLIMLQQLKGLMTGQAITPKLLKKMLVSFAQDFGDAWKRRDRTSIDPSVPVFNSGLDVGWVVWPGHSF